MESSGNSKSVPAYKKAFLSPKALWTLKDLGIRLEKVKQSLPRKPRK